MSKIGLTINIHVSTGAKISCEYWMDPNHDLYLLELEDGRQSVTIFIPASEASRIQDALNNPVITRHIQPPKAQNTISEHNRFDGDSHPKPQTVLGGG